MTTKPRLTAEFQPAAKTTENAAREKKKEALLAIYENSGLKRGLEALRDANGATFKFDPPTLASTMPCLNIKTNLGLTIDIHPDKDITVYTCGVSMRKMTQYNTCKEALACLTKTATEQKLSQRQPPKF